MNNVKQAIFSASGVAIGAYSMLTPDEVVSLLTAAATFVMATVTLIRAITELTYRIKEIINRRKRK